MLIVHQGQLIPAISDRNMLQNTMEFDWDWVERWKVEFDWNTDVGLGLYDGWMWYESKKSNIGSIFNDGHCS